MAASELTPIIVSRGVGLTLTADAVSTANQVEFDSDTGFYVDVGDTTQSNDASKMILIVTGASSASTDGGIKILSSTNSPFTGSGIADLAVNLTTDTARFDADSTTSAGPFYVSAIGPLETARFRDTDGYINVEYDTDHAGMVTVLRAFALIVP